MNLEINIALGRKTLQVRMANEYDVSQIVQIHQLSFRQYFLTQLGRRALKAYYQFFVDHIYGICFVVEQGGRVIGFVSGWQQGSTYQLPLIQACKFDLSVAIIAMVLRRPITSWRLLWPHILPSVKLLIKSFSQSQQVIREKEINSVIPNAQTMIWNTINASLLSIAVLPEFRGGEAANLLDDAFRSECKRRRLPEITLTVAKENLRAQAFYAKKGWKLVRISENTYGYVLSLLCCD